MAKQIAERLDLGQYFRWNDYAEVLDWQLQQVGSSLAEMPCIGVKNFLRLTPFYWGDRPPRRLSTGAGKIELYSTMLATQGFDPLPVYMPLAEPPRATTGCCTGMCRRTPSAAPSTTRCCSRCSPKTYCGSTRWWPPSGAWKSGGSA